ncbi:MAG: transglutaminaseTgpA domain-containing protein [Parvibaculales bacterium]
MPAPKRLDYTEIKTSAMLLGVASAPIALALAMQTHFVVFVNWALLWGFALLPRTKWRLVLLIVGVVSSLGVLRAFIPVLSEEYFMAMVLLLGVPEHLDKNGRPNPFNLLTVVFPALCVMVLSVNLLVFVLMLVSTAFYIGVFVLRYNRMPLSGLRIRLLPVLAALGGAFLVTMVLFLILPRLETQELPGFQLNEAESGVTDTLDIGRFSSVIQREDIAFRAFMPVFPSNEALYWRVYLLAENEDGKWSRGVSAADPLVPVTKLRANRNYAVRHAGGNKAWLPLLGAPAADALDPSLKMTFGGEVVSRDKKDLGMKTWTLGTALVERMDLRLPTSLKVDGNPRLRDWALEKRAAYASDAAFIDFVMAQFGSAGYRYSLSAPQLSGDKIDQFFFETKTGYCSHYAIATASILRAAGIPANVVIGYSGGTWNEFGNYVVVRQSDAHAWVEAKPDGQAWVRLDPTIAVPFAQNAQATSAFGTSPTPIAVQPAQVDEDFRERLQTWLRWADNFFIQINNDIVLYDNNSREAFLSRFDAGKLVSYLTFWVIGSLALLFPFAFLRWYLLQDPMLSLDKDFMKLAARAGLQRAESEGRLVFADRLAAQTGGAAMDIRGFARQWCRGYFSSAKPGKAEINAMRQRLKSIRQKMYQAR